MKRKFVLAFLASMAIGSAWADQPFRNARWDSFHALKPAGTDIVFVGNSITNMHQWWEALGGQNNVLNRGTSGGFTTEVLPNLETIIAGHPAKVFIGIGTNDICETLSLETTADNVRIIAERIRRESPDTEVYIQSLIPSTNNNPASVDIKGRGVRIPAINQLYKQHAEALNAKYGKVHYLDVNTPLAAADGISLKRSAQNQSIAFDNLHPNAVGYKYWLDAIKDQTGFDCIYKEQTMVGGMSNNNAFGDCLTSFEQFPVKATDILMVGSDAIHNGEWHEFMKSGDFKNRGLGWGKFSIAINQLYTIVERSLAAEGSVAPKAIVLYADKDCNNSTAAATQMESLKTAISQIKAKAPTSEIFVISTLPNTAAAKNNIVTEFNSLLANNAESVGYTFVDAYTPINENRSLYMNGTDYVYTRGYAKIAQVLADALNTKLHTSYTALTDDEAAANVTNYNARTTLGNAITSALRFNNDKYKGEGIGQYSAAAYANLDDALTTSFTLLNSDYTAEQLSEQATSLAGTVPAINQPTTALVDGKQWQIIALRGNRYVSSNGVGQGVTGKEANNQNYSRWTLSQREDGSWNFQNVDDASYLVPASGDTNQLVTSASEPSLGWTFAGSQTPGSYIISSTGGIQLHTLGSYNIANWGGGSNTTDEGCQFRIVEIEGEPDVLPDTPEHGKVFTVYNDHVGTPYYLNDQLTSSCTALTTTEADDKSQQWIVWGNATSGYKFYNVKNPSQLLTCNAGVQNLDISTAHSKIGVSLRNHGTNQHMAGNKSTLTLNGGKFSADNAQYNETGDWSTDFVFLATGENAYKVASDNVTISGTPYANGDWVITTTELTTADVTVEEGYKAVITNNTITAVEKGDVTFVEERVTNQSEIVAGTKIALKINVSGHNNGWIGIPNGSAETKTWYTVENGATAGTIRLKTSDGKYIGTDLTAYVDEADAVDFTLQAEQNGTDNARYIFKRPDGQCLVMPNEAALPATWWEYSAGQRLRLEVYKQTEVEQTPEEPTTVYYTLTNHQKNNTTYTLYIYNGELTVSSANASATSLGDAALFTKEVHGDKWAFKSKTTGQYLVWRGSSDGYNGNKGVTDTFNATYCDFTPNPSQNYTGGYYFVSKRGDGSTDGSWVILNNGDWDKYGASEGWQDGHSNIFTVDEVTAATPGQLEGTEVNLGFNAGTLSGGSGNYRQTWTSSSTPAVTVSAYNKTDLVNNLPTAQASDAGFIVYTGNRNAAGTSNVTPYTSYLRVSAPAGYYVTGYSFDLASHDLTAAGVTVATPKGSSLSVNNTSATQSEEYVFGDASHTYFDLTLTGENKGIKFTNFKVYVKELENVEEPTLAFEVSPEPTDGTFAEDTKWYALRFCNGGYWIANDDNSVTVQGRVPDATNAAGLWAITGDETKGYSIYNQAKGASVRLTYTGVGDDVKAMLSASGTAAFTLATSTASTNPQAYTFHFDNNCYINKYKGGSTVSTWNSASGVNDSGSSIIFEAAENLTEDLYNSYYVFDNAASPVIYRIPAIATNKDGDIICVADYRHSGQDIGIVKNGRLDLHYRIRNHETGEWGEISPLVIGGTNWKNESGNKYVKADDGVFTSFGDPCIVADRESDLVMVSSCCGNVSFPGGSPEDHQGWSRFISTDGGKTWSDYYVDLAPQVFEQINKRTDGYQLKCFFIGSGKITQSRTVKVGEHYRLYCAALTKIYKPGVNNSDVNCNYAFYSDDFGLTWHLLGSADDCPIPSGADEPKAEELPDGSVMVSSRKGGGRKFNVFHYTDTKNGIGSWGACTDSDNGNSGILSANCNGEIMTVPVKDKITGDKTFLLLQSVPRDASQRINVSIFWKELTDLSKYRTAANFAPNWPNYLQVSNTTSGYSTMCMDKENNIAFFTEENGARGGYDMVYKKVTIEQLTGDKYEYYAMTPADSVAYLSAGVDPFLKSVKDTNFGPYVGQYAESAQSTIEAATAAYKDAPATATYDALNTALATATTRRINPAKQYRLINLGRDGKAMVGATEKFTGADVSADAANQRFVFESAGDGKWYLKSKDANVYFGKLAADENEVPAVTTTDNAGTFIIEVDSNGNAQFLCTNKSGSHAYIHLAGDNTRLVPWNAGSGSPASQWHILPIDEPLDITGEGVYTQLDVEALTNIVSGVATKENNESGKFNYNFDAADLNDDNVYTIGDIARLIRLLLEAEEQK